jgi:ribosomal protein S18 acetylase RimI-like enzyme
VTPHTAFEDGRLVGTVGYSRETYPKERHRVVIWGVYVAPEVRRSGIARALITAAINRIAKLRGVDTVVLSVSESAPGARKLYVSLGFRPYGLDKRALKVGGKFVGEEPMVLALR